MPRVSTTRCTAKRGKKRTASRGDYGPPSAKRQQTAKSQHTNGKRLQGTDESNSKPPEMSTEEKREYWFSRYQDLDRDDNQQLITPEKFMQLCQEIGYDMNGIEPFVLTWKLGGSELGTIDWQNWNRSLAEMKATDNESLKKTIDATILQLQKDRVLFKAFYRKMFDYLLSRGEKLISVEDFKNAIPVITNQHWLFMKFVRFLDSGVAKVKKINRDQWQSMLELSRVVDENFSNYSKDDAWPSLFDDFSDWIIAQQT